VAAEDGADLADHARAVLVREHEDVPFRNELDVQVPEPDDPRRASNTVPAMIFRPAPAWVVTVTRLE